MENEYSGLGRMFITSLRKGDIEGVPSPEQWHKLYAVEPASSAPCEDCATQNSDWPSFKASITIDGSVTNKSVVAAYHLRRMDLITHRRRWYRFLYKDKHYKGPHYCTLYFYLWAMALLGDDAVFAYKFRKSFNGLYFVGKRGKHRPVHLFRKKLSQGSRK